jgi:hypothetical protein
VEDALCDSAGMRYFVGIDLGREPVPDGHSRKLYLRESSGNLETGLEDGIELVKHRSVRAFPSDD